MKKLMFVAIFSIITGSTTVEGENTEKEGNFWKNEKIFIDWQI